MEEPLHEKQIIIKSKNNWLSVFTFLIFQFIFTILIFVLIIVFIPFFAIIPEFLDIKILVVLSLLISFFLLKIINFYYDIDEQLLNLKNKKLSFITSLLKKQIVRLILLSIFLLIFIYFSSLFLSLMLISIPLLFLQKNIKNYFNTDILLIKSKIHYLFLMLFVLDFSFIWVDKKFMILLCILLLIYYILIQIIFFIDAYNRKEKTILQKIKIIILHIFVLFSSLGIYSILFFPIMLLETYYFDLLKNKCFENCNIETLSINFCNNCPNYGKMYLKPVIYLYPQTTTQVKVQLDYQGELIADYPDYNEDIKGWEVLAYPDGKLINLADKQEYSYLFWEGMPSKPSNWDLSQGFVVKGEDTKKFLQTVLPKMGLTPKEYNEFIVYWYPLMKDNKYNLIHFAEEEYTKTAPLTITPPPDSMLRVFMVFKGLDKPINIKEQKLKPFARTGFSVIEWGGTEIN